LTQISTSTIKRESTILKDISSSIKSEVMNSIYNDYLEYINQQVINGNISDIIISDEQIKDIYDYMKDNMINHNLNNNNTIIQAKNAAFQVSTIENQKKKINGYHLLI
jgi:hypothetical protein